MNKNIAISFEHVSKMYRLGLVGTGTLSQDLNRWWKMNVLRQEDPYLKLGETNDRASKGKSDYVYALKDISFDVEQGDVVGIIGKNGAGKSTLLKLLSRITAPSTGSIKARGRIASLLEVGTGFHPELTGRENIYMNGSIMGMTRREIDRKLDEIVDFAGIERYLDTPTKRYSSGMTVRLGFAVAAFLEPEILVVDEVLAVGDAEFQKKAIGKMQDVAQGEGRTVLFVSHNMDSMLNLCHHGLLLGNGIVQYMGNIKDVVAEYLGDNNLEYTFYQEDSKHPIFVSKVLLTGTDAQQKGMFSIEDNIKFQISLCQKNKVLIDPKTVLSVYLMTMGRTKICHAEIPLKEYLNNDIINLYIDYPSCVLMPGKYLIKVDIHNPNVKFYDRQDTCAFSIFDNGTEFMKYGNINNGLVFLRPKVKVE